MDYTRIRAPYVNPDGFRFTAYRRGLFSGIAKRLGMQDVEGRITDLDRLRQLYDLFALTLDQLCPHGIGG